MTTERSGRWGKLADVRVRGGHTGDASAVHTVYIWPDDGMFHTRADCRIRLQSGPIPPLLNVMITPEAARRLGRFACWTCCEL